MYNFQTIGRVGVGVGGTQQNNSIKRRDQSNKGNVVGLKSKTKQESMVNLKHKLRR